MLDTCCAPSGCLCNGASISIENSSTVPVICSNSQCPCSGFMHKSCFKTWESTLFGYLLTLSDASSWAIKRGREMLWTPQCLELIYPACICSCQQGHLRPILSVGDTAEDRTKLRRSSKSNLSIQTSPLANSPIRGRTNSLGSSESCLSSGSNSPRSPISVRNLSSPSNISKCIISDFVERPRHYSGNSIFARRVDFSVFNTLPKHKVNSYHIKMEDEGSQGNDEIRSFLLSTLASAKMSHTYCVLCSGSMPVYDKYPIVDGTFFLSPRQHSRTCVQVRFDGKNQYLCSVCMCCLEGWSLRLQCVACQRFWQGGHLVLGTLYTYDIFAATACCALWLSCTTCERPVIEPDQRLTYFSDYSHILSCPFCTSVDHHFVKKLFSMFRVLAASSASSIQRCAMLN